MQIFLQRSAVLVFAVFVFAGCGGAPESQFPLPKSVENFSEQGSADAINFQTSLSSAEVREFYETAFVNEGLTQNDLLSVEEDGVVSLVFDGHSSGQSVVVQSVELSTGKTNINVRLEAL